MFPFAIYSKNNAAQAFDNRNFDVTCNTAGMKGNIDAENAFRHGDLNDVPDLIELLHDLAGDSMTVCDALYNFSAMLCSILPPNSPRIYSIANSPPQGIEPNIVTIVVSKLWFEAEKKDVLSVHRKPESSIMADRLKSSILQPTA